jgi:hypothetical protein
VDWAFGRHVARRGHCDGHTLVSGAQLERVAIRQRYTCRRCTCRGIMEWPFSPLERHSAPRRGALDVHLGARGWRRTSRKLRGGRVRRRSGVRVLDRLLVGRVMRLA